MASKNRFRLTRRAFLGWLLVLGEDAAVYLSDRSS